ncbi:hypothetical protein JOD24_001945 [Kroppenstedtia sanguinis]
MRHRHYNLNELKPWNRGSTAQALQSKGAEALDEGSTTGTTISMG